MRAPEHPREAERLAAVDEIGLVGGLPDELQQAAVHLASQICGTPIAAVSLVDRDRQWFSAIEGLDCRETPRDVAFCAHTILGDSPLVVCDATQDSRFSDNALVTGDPRIRFYAGIPLKTLDDPAVGSLCVIDSSPREISSGQLQSLQTLADLVAAQLEMHRYNHRITRRSEESRSLLERITKIASQVPGVIYQFRTRPDGTSSFPYASERIKEIYRVTPEEVEHDASAVLAVLHPDDREGVETSIAESLRTLRPWKHEYRVRFDDGSEEWLLGNAIPQREADGSTLWHGFIQKITDRKVVEAALLDSQRIIGRQNTELTKMADRAHQVVDDVSHEFRTPLAVIKEFASIISDGIAGPVSDDQAMYLQIMSGAVVDLNHMVEDLLDSSKLRAGILRVDRRSATIHEIFAEGRPALASKASTRSITIEERLGEGLPSVFADSEKVRRVISNLMTNAIKFSPEGGTIELSATAGPGAGEATISVTDNGPGLSAEDIDQLFGRFKQTSTARSIKAKGFGLGLSIAQELAWLNLGRLSVQSVKGQGATFSFTLPTDDPAAILSHYFDSIQSSEVAGTRFALLRALATGGSRADEAGAFLASIVYPSDLVLPGLRDEGGHAWYVLGCTDSAESWSTKLRAACRQRSSSGRDDLQPISIELEGQWDRVEHFDDAMQEAYRVIAKENCHGTARADH